MDTDIKHVKCGHIIIGVRVRNLGLGNENGGDGFPVAKNPVPVPAV